MSFSWKPLSEYPLLLDEQGELSPQFKAADAGLVPLGSEGILTVEGPDTLKFLQGQMTCDFNELKGTQFLLGGCCTPKGRMVSSFVAYQWPQQDRISLRMHLPLVEVLKQHLQKYSVFFKAKMLDQSADYWRLGVFAADLDARFQALGIPIPQEAFQACAWGEQGVVLRWDADLVEIWLSTSATTELSRLLEEFEGWTATEHWQARWLALGFGAVRAATQEHFIPQMLNLQHTRGISFTKGCYTGQEIVARLQHRGTIKRALYPLTMQADERPLEGAPIETPGKATPVGEVVMSGRSTEGQIQLAAVLEKQYLKGPLTLAGGKPLTLHKLPYALEGE
jgi:folate-binding protein YgfZ